MSVHYLTLSGECHQYGSGEGGPVTESKSLPRRLMPVVAISVTLGVLALYCASLNRGVDAEGLIAQTEGDELTLPPEHGGHLVYGIETDPNGLDPTRNAWDPVGIQVANALYDPLAAFDSTGTPRPYLAEAIEPEPGSNYTSWRVKLRPGVTFQSGRPVDAVAVKSYVDAVTGERIDANTGLKRGSITQDAARYITATEVVGPLELVLQMRRPWATFPALLTGQGGYVISPEQLDDPDGHSAPDGAGPFLLRSWKIGERMQLVRNPSYWRSGLPYLDSVDFEVIVDGDARVGALERGTIDVVSAGYVQEVKAIDELARSQQEHGTSAQIRIERDQGPSEAIMIMLNVLKKPLDNPLVRGALAYATNVEALARDNGWNTNRMITGPFASTSPWYTPTEMPRYNLAKARALVAEYKQETGASEISFELQGIHQPAMLRQLQEQWAAAGITVRVTMTDFRKAVPISVGGSYDALQFRYFSFVDPDSLYHFFTTETSRPVGQISLNFTRFGNDTMDDAMVKGRSTTDPVVRRAAYATLQRQLAEHLPYIWLFRSEWVVARSARVHNARNVTLPDGTKALPFDTGTHRLTETWVSG
jgi:peptide/nickel transport system substrate-binding protein